MAASTPSLAKAQGSSTPNGSARTPSAAGYTRCRPKPIPVTSMRVSPDPKQTALLIAAMTAAGFILTLYVFYPGVMTFDALYIYKDMAKGTFGDWQSPAMIVLWS